MSARNRFQRGSGCYTCQSCKKKTRSTGNGDNEHVLLCVDCYDIAGIENFLSDNGPEETAATYGEGVRYTLKRRPEMIETCPELAAVCGVKVPIQFTAEFKNWMTGIVRLVAEGQLDSLAAKHMIEGRVRDQK